MRDDGLIGFESEDERKAWVAFAHWLGSGVGKNGARAKILAIIERWLAAFSETHDRAERLQRDLDNLRGYPTQPISVVDPDLSH